MELRQHQRDALMAIRRSLAEKRNPAAQLATGTGKSLIIADLASDADYKVWVLTHSQELVKQNAETYHRYTGAQAGIVCSGLNRFDYAEEVIFGTIQSVINPALRGEMCKPNLIIIDEAHRVNHKTGEAGQYGQVFNAYPAARRIAMTATPWRMDNGIIYGDDPQQYWFDSLCFKYTVAQGVVDGWLSPLVGVETETQLDLDGVAVGDDYNTVEVGDRENVEWMRHVGSTLRRLAATRKHIAVYCPSVTAMMRAAGCIKERTGWTVATVYGNMKPGERAESLKDFRSGKVRVLCSVDTLTTGWDMPALDCIVCLRPTVSSSLWVQILGRGTRISEGKKNCVVLDFVGNLQRLGGVDCVDTYVRERSPFEVVEARPAPKRPPRVELPGVRSLVPIDPMTGGPVREGAVLTVAVSALSAVPMVTRRNPGVPVLMLNYTTVTPEGAKIDATLFLDTMRNTRTAWDFFKARALAVDLPAPAQDLIWQVRGARRPSTVTIRKSGRYWNVIDEHWGDTTV